MVSSFRLAFKSRPLQQIGTLISEHFCIKNIPTLITSMTFGMWQKTAPKSTEKNQTYWYPGFTLSNHLYWSAQTCNGNSDLLREKWTSSINHIANIHHWNRELMTQCEHETTDDIDWLTVDSDTHRALKNMYWKHDYWTTWTDWSTSVILVTWSHIMPCCWSMHQCSRLRENIIRTALCRIVWHNVHSQQHTFISALLTGPTDWVCHIRTLIQCIEAVA